MRTGNKTKQHRVIARVKVLLIARRNRKYEQVAYDKVVTLCDEYGTDPDEAIEISTAWLRRNDLSLMLNGVIGKGITHN